MLRTVDSGEGSLFVPAVATTTGLLLLLLSVAMLVSYIHHVATAIQVSSIIAAIGRETRQALDERFPSGTDTPAGDPTALPPDGLPSALLPAPTSGVVTVIDDRALVRRAAEADVLVRCRVRFGQFVVAEGAAVLEVVGDAEEVDAGVLLAAVTQGRNRTMHQDVAFGFRQLVDIAERALSPGVNDPTTAVQALDELHDLLRRMVTRPLRSGVHVDDDGRVRLVMQAECVEDFLALALDEVEQYGADAIPVQHKLDSMLDDLRAAALPQHRRAVEERIRRRACRV